MAYRKNKDYSKELNIPAKGFELIDLRTINETQDYCPYKNIQIINNGGGALKLYINGQKFYKYIPAGSIYERQDKEIYFLKIENIDDTNPTKAILTLDNDYSETELLKYLVFGDMEAKK